ncbi:MAG: glycine C-acetyltransferase [Phycisphaerales bacterium]|nr:glycine C-acetyltransferase [Phycisphaerales bacterium]
MFTNVKDGFLAELKSIDDAGLRKRERVITTPQGATIRVAAGPEVLNFCANNYLGLGNHPRLIEAAKRSLDSHGFGMASVRFICGTQDLHKQLEGELARFLGFDDAILYTSCFDANGGLFETLLGENDAIVSDALNHASIIDGIRLAKAHRFRYEHLDFKDLKAKLDEAKAVGARRILVATDGVFSMDGDIADLKTLCDIAESYGAMVMVDDSHATGFVGRTGRGTPEHCGVMGRVDILTSTLGKALGGASGGFTCARQEIVDLLRQRSRPYLFSNTVAPPIAAIAVTRERLALSDHAAASFYFLLLPPDLLSPLGDLGSPAAAFLESAFTGLDSGFAASPLPASALGPSAFASLLAPPDASPELFASPPPLSALAAFLYDSER